MVRSLSSTWREPEQEGEQRIDESEQWLCGLSRG